LLLAAVAWGRPQCVALRDVVWSDALVGWGIVDAR
jgi:hypothetical protein